MRAGGRGEAGAGWRRIGISDTVPRQEAEIAQDAQRIFVDPVAGVADEADTPAFQIFKTAEIIAVFAGQGIGVKRVYGEIAPGRILPPIVAEREDRKSTRLNSSH